MSASMSSVNPCCGKALMVVLGLEMSVWMSGVAGSTRLSLTLR
jgi:hypothetical protein